MTADNSDKTRGDTRDAKGRFLPKNHASQGAGGRPPILRPIRDLAKEHSVAAIQSLVSIMQNNASHPSARVAAAKEILDRGEGKVTQPVDATLGGGLTVRWQRPGEA